MEKNLPYNLNIQQKPNNPFKTRTTKDANKERLTYIQWFAPIFVLMVNVSK